MNNHSFYNIILLYFVLLSVSNLFSQNQRFIYDYRFLSDSTNTQDIKSELMFLDVTEKFSKFYSGENYINDSIAKANLEKQIIATGGIDNLPKSASTNKSLNKYTVIKQYPSDLFFITRIGRYKYKVEDTRLIKWTILPDKDIIKTFSVQKATTEFGGRKWIAWFTNEIPIQDGPYKFKGLPGMILRMEDQTKSHSFTLAGIKNLSVDELKKITPTGNFVFDFGDNLNVDFFQYKRLYLESRINPIKYLKQTLQDMDKINVDGVMVDTKIYLRDKEIQLKEIVRKDNNIIEIEMLNPN